jgi:RHS repeat-associated protein
MPLLDATEVVWFDDALPAGGQMWGTVLWESLHKASGTVSARDPYIAGPHESGFSNATAKTTPALRDQMYVYALLDPCNVPATVLVSWAGPMGWQHAGYWGVDSFPYDQRRVRIGDVPPAGQWVRLSFPAARTGLEGWAINGLVMKVADGRVWYDRPGRFACTPPVAPAPSSFPAGETVWFDDALPAGAAVSGTWTWDETQKASGTKSWHDSGTVLMRDQSFGNATERITPAVGEKLFVYVQADPCAPPREILVEWQDRWGAWNHRAYWGEDLFVDTPRVRIGDVPAAGSWVKLEVPAATVTMEGQEVRGLRLKIWGGRAWFDRAGKSAATMGAMTLPAPMISSGAEAPVVRKPLRQRMKEWWRRVRGRDEYGQPISLAFTTVFAQTIAPTNSTTARRYSFYTPELQLMSETALTTATTPTIANDYVWFNGEPLAQISSTGEVAYYFNDHLGAPILQTNTTGAIIWRAEREPYGSIFVTRAGAERHQPLSLPGQEYDANQAERAYNVFRWYRSSWGRYTQADPLSKRPSISPIQYLREEMRPYPIRYVHPAVSPPAMEQALYAYADSNPILLIDPYGLYSVDSSCDCQLLTPHRNDLETQVDAWCAHGLPTITDRRLRECISESCNSGVIRCSNTCLRTATRAQAGFNRRFPFTTNRTANICTFSGGWNSIQPPGDTVIHEWAHGCGWREGGGRGVPDW